MNQIHNNKPILNLDVTDKIDLFHMMSLGMIQFKFSGIYIMQ